MRPHSSASFHFLQTRSRATAPASFVRPRACASYVIDLWQNFFLRSHLIFPVEFVSAEGVGTQTHCVASVSDLKVVATMPIVCTSGRSFRWPFRSQLRFFPPFTPVWRAGVWISGDTLEFTQKKTYCLLSLGASKGFSSSHSDVKKNVMLCHH